jgi:hypothetical protein
MWLLICIALLLTAKKYVHHVIMLLVLCSSHPQSLMASVPLSLNYLLLLLLSSTSLTIYSFPIRHQFRVNVKTTVATLVFAKDIPSNSSFELNAGKEVPLRILYTPEMLKRLAEGIKSKLLPAYDRASLLTDSYAFVKAGCMEPAVLVELLS